ncbi:MAG: potassium-transporting ATPase subunit KdpA, partial [Spirochaetes bacterium]|nr:potassium-transporting ATPase subunit KdpA [Spirochaetota bacterium]
MNYYDITALIIFFTVLIALSLILGRYMARIYYGERTFMSPIIQPVEKAVYRICSVNESEEMTWKTYALSFLLFNIAGIIFLTILQMSQGFLPLNPQKLPGVGWDTALNTAVSFVTNTNWQSYSGETTMSYLTQMLGLTVQNFLSAGIGMAAGVSLIRGFVRRESAKIGNLWVDMTRSVLYILLPISIIICVLLTSLGVIQSLDSYKTALTLEHSVQIIPMGPVGSQIAIKQLGSNGGGFFNANSAHPFENPSFYTNIIENFSILLIPMAFVFMFGYMIKNLKHSRALFYAMMILFLLGFGIIVYSE